MPDGPPSSLRVVAAGVLVVLADGQHQLALARELHHPVVHVRADPDVVGVVDEDAVRVARPVGRVLLGLLAPALHHLAVLVELDDRRRRLAAGAHRRGLLLVELLFGEGLGQVGDPDVVLGVDEHAGDRAQDPVVRELLRPGRVDLEGRSGLRSLPGAAAAHRRAGQDRHPPHRRHRHPHPSRHRLRPLRRAPLPGPTRYHARSLDRPRPYHFKPFQGKPISSPWHEGLLHA